MNQPSQTEKQTGKRIVSKGAYARAQAKRTSICLAGVCSMLICCLCILVVFGFALWALFDRAAFLTFLKSGWFLLLIPLLGGGIVFGMKKGVAAIDRADAIDPGVPLTRANTADFPASDSLVRASEEPRQEQEGVLLRAAAASVERHEEQLVRASAGGTE